MVAMTHGRREVPSQDRGWAEMRPGWEAKTREWEVHGGPHADEASSRVFAGLRTGWTQADEDRRKGKARASTAALWRSCASSMYHHTVPYRVFVHPASFQHLFPSKLAGGFAPPSAGREKKRQAHASRAEVCGGAWCYRWNSLWTADGHGSRPRTGGELAR